MVCNKCGKKITDGVVFCTYCGSVMSQSQSNQIQTQQQAQMQQQMNNQQVTQQHQFYYQQQVPYIQPVPNQEPVNIGKKKRKGLVIGLAAAVVSLLVCIVALVILLLSKDKDSEQAEIVVSSYEQSFEMLIEAINEKNYDQYKTLCYDNEINSEEYFDKLYKATVDSENEDIYKPEIMAVIDSRKFEPESAEDFLREVVYDFDKFESKITDYAVIYAAKENADNGINVVIVKIDNEWKILEIN